MFQRLAKTSFALILALSTTLSCSASAFAVPSVEAPNVQLIVQDEETPGDEVPEEDPDPDSGNTNTGDPGSGSGNTNTGDPDPGSGNTNTGGDPDPDPEEGDARVSAIDLYLMGGQETSVSISKTGNSVELYMQLFMSDTFSRTWTDWVNLMGSPYAGSYYAISSDETVAKVSTESLQQGQVKVTAGLEGTAQITVCYTPYGGTDADAIISKAFTLTVPPQLKEYVTSIDIIDMYGNSISDDGIEFFEVGEYQQLYVRLKWHSDDTGKDWEEITSGEVKTIEGVAWESDNPDLVYINSDTGRMSLQPGNGSSALITVRTMKGVNATEVKDSVYAYYSGQSRSYVPAQDLTISVVYEEMPVEYTPTEHVFSIDEVISLCGGLQNQAYTYFTGNGSYSTHFAQGVNLYDVLKLVDVKIDDIKLFYFQSRINDGYETPFSYDQLYNTTHYLCTEPELGYESSSGLWKQFSFATTPLLAVAATTVQGKSLYEYIDGSGVFKWPKLNGDQQFRLEVGCTGPSDSKAQSKSVYNVDTIRIMLKGGPPAAGSTGDGNTDGEGTGEAVNTTGDETTNTQGVGAQTEQPTAQQSSTASETSSKRWQVYQMMNDIESQAEEIPYVNPLEPYALPAAAITILAGGLTMGIGYKRRIA